MSVTLTITDGAQTTSLVVPIMNPFGGLNDVNADDPVRFANFRTLGLPVYRLRACIKDSTIAWSKKPADVIAAGFMVQVVIKWTTSANGPSTAPTDKALFKSRVQQVIDTVGPQHIAFVTFENEFDNRNKFWNAAPDDATNIALYAQTLQWGAEQVHTNPGLKCSDGALTIQKHQACGAYQWLVDNMSQATADDYWSKAVSTWVKKTDVPQYGAEALAWHAALAPTDADFVNLHYYNDHDPTVGASEDAIFYYKLYLETLYGKTMVVNEGGLRTTVPGRMTSFAQRIHDLKIPAWVWYAVFTTEGTQGFWTTGTTTINITGSELQAFMAAHYGPTW